MPPARVMFIREMEGNCFVCLKPTWTKAEFKMERIFALWAAIGAAKTMEGI